MGATNTEIMVSLLRTLKVETNGAVVGAMEARGLHYPLSYGVSLPAIKRIATEYAPNPSLAQLLYRQQVRELRLAALYVADAGSATIDQADFWAAGISTSEIAEVLAMAVVSKSPDAEQFVAEWLRSDNELVKYAAIMIAARAAKPAWNLARLAKAAAQYAQSDNILLIRGAELLSDRLMGLS